MSPAVLTKIYRVSADIGPQAARSSWIVAACLALAASLLSAPVLASEYQMLALQREGQASIAFDDAAKAAYIVDLGHGQDGDRVKFGAKDLIDYLAVERKVEHLVITCSHPHSDHMGGIKALFTNARPTFFYDGDLSRPKFKSLIVIDNGVPDSLGRLYAKFATEAGGSSAIDFRHLDVTGPDGAARDAFADLPFEQKDLRIRNVAYAPQEAADIHGRSIITVTDLRQGLIVDFDDADSGAIRSAVEALKRSGVSEIDAFVVPHHGSRYHEIEPILDLKPKRALIAVNPSNRFGHPSAEIVLQLLNRLPPENVLFSGSESNVVFERSGTVTAAHTAADPDTYDLFFAEREKVIDARAPNPNNAKEKAALAQVRQRLAAASAAAGPGRPGTSRGVTPLLAQRAAATGSMLPLGLEAAYVPSSGTSRDALTSTRVFRSPDVERAVIYTTANEPLSEGERRLLAASNGILPEVRYETASGLPSAILPNEPPPSGGRSGPAAGSGPPSPGNGGRPPPPPPVPRGGMVYLDGGKVTIEGAGSELAGARLVRCGAMACLQTREASYQLPFRNVALLGEVLWRVNNGTTSFYLSINPRKRLLQPNFSLARIPPRVLRYGVGPGGSEAFNDVVTAGGIERSRIGDILWRADVAFKSEALGVDVLTGAARPTNARLFVSSSRETGTAGPAVAEGDRWCRLYWTSASPRFRFETGKMIAVGPAVEARAEAMRPQNGSLVSYRRGKWCAREERVAVLLQQQANAAGASGVLGELRDLALMQSFALWAKSRHIDTSEVATTPIATAQIPSWTSGVRTPNSTVIKPERAVSANFQNHAVHVWSADPNIGRCLNRGELIDAQFEALKMQRNAKGAWTIDRASYPKLNTWMTNVSAKIARCSGGRIEPVLVNSDVDPVRGMAAEVSVPIHMLSSQIHGGVLLGSNRRTRFFESAFGPNGFLWAPDDRLLFRRIGKELHFWNLIGPSADKPLGAQHAVFTAATVEDVHASGGHLRFVVSAEPGAIVRNELRLSGANADKGVEWLGVYRADGSRIVEKTATPCPATAAQPNCIAVENEAFGGLTGRLRAMSGSAPVMGIRRLAEDLWLVDLDMGRLEASLRASRAASAPPDPSRTLATARDLSLWGFDRSAEALVEAVLPILSPEADDSILREQFGGLDFQELGLGIAVAQAADEAGLLFAQKGIGAAEAAAELAKLYEVASPLSPDASALALATIAGSCKTLLAGAPADRQATVVRQVCAKYERSAAIKFALADRAILQELMNVLRPSEE